jgi:hypothetical protein
MSDKKISQLSSSGTITGAEEVPVVQSGSTVKTTINAIKTFFDTIYTTTSAVATQITTALSGYVNTGGLTTNYIPKASDSDTLANGLMQDNGSGVGVNTVPLANTIFASKGSDSTSSNFAARFVNSSNAVIADFRNDARLTLSVTNNTNFYPLELRSTNISLSRIQHLHAGGVKADIQIGVNNGGNSIYIGVDGSSKGHIDNRTGQNFEFQIGGTPKLTIDTSGNLALANLTASQIVETDASKNLISAAKNSGYNLALGTTAGTVLEGNRITQTITNGVTDKAPSEDAVFDALAAKKDTFLLQSNTSLFNPADATTYYIGLSTISPNTTDTNFAFKIGYNFRIIGSIITSTTNGTSGTTENSTINFKNITTATSSLISNSVKTNATTTASINQTVTGLNITGLATDDVCFEWITPTWVTNPTTSGITLRIFIEKTS